jgi:hypothetical protein
MIMAAMNSTPSVTMPTAANHGGIMAALSGYFPANPTISRVFAAYCGLFRQFIPE